MLALILLFSALGHAAAPKPADADTVKAVDYFIDTAAEEIKPELMGRFLEIDPETLPKRQKQPFLDKRFKMHALRHAGKHKKKGFVRSVETGCSPPAESKTDNAGMLRRTGFEEIMEDELEYMKKKTRCTEEQLMCESSLQLTVVRDPKTKKFVRRYIFLAPADPLMVYVVEHRKQVGGQTQFFGTGGGFICE